MEQINRKCSYCKHFFNPQAGGLLRDQLQDFFNQSVVQYAIKHRGNSRSELEAESQRAFRLYPRRYQEILLGLSETSGLNLSDVLILSWAPASAGCSGIAAWGDYSTDGKLVFGRNADYYSSRESFSNRTCVIVYNPDDGSNSVASVCCLGQLQVPTGLNDKGIFMEWNDGSISGGSIFYPDRLSFTGSLLFDWSDLSQIDSAVMSSRSEWPCILNFANSSASCSYERATFDVKKREPDKDGLMVATNHFVDRQWGVANPFGDPNYTVTRRMNLLALGEMYKGEFSPEIMRKVLDTPLEHGGATGNFTRIQVVALPEELKIWVKIPGYQDWVMVDLKGLFTCAAR